MASREDLLRLIYSEFFNVPDGETMFRLYGELGQAAARWRGTQPSDSSDADLSLDVVAEYHQIFQKLVEMGWDWRGIDVDCMLPDALMPDVVYETHSPAELMQMLLRGVRWWHQKISRPTLEIYSFDKAYGRLLDLGIDPESQLPPQNSRESNVIWFGIPLSPEKYYERHPERTRPNSWR